MPHHYFPDLIPAWGQHYSCGSQRSGKQKKKKKKRDEVCVFDGGGGLREQSERVHACLEVTQTWGIIINNLPSSLYMEERWESGERRDEGRVREEWRGGWSPVGRGQPLASKKKKSKAQSVCYFLVFFFWSFSHTRWCARGRASITGRRQACVRGKKDERLKCAEWGKKDGLRKERGGWQGAPLSRLGVILQLGMCWCYQGAGADHHSRPERRDSQRGSFMISPICSPTLSAEALVTLPNTCKPSGFPTTAKTIVAHCGWCYKERRKTVCVSGGGTPRCPCDTCGFIHKVWSFNLTWNSDMNTVALGEKSTVAASSELLHQRVHSAATLKQRQLSRGPIGKANKQKNRESFSSLLASSWTALPLGWLQVTPREFHVATTVLHLFGFNLPPWNEREVSRWCDTRAASDNNASNWVTLQLWMTSHKKAECFVGHINTEVFFFSV